MTRDQDQTRLNVLCHEAVAMPRDEVLAIDKFFTDRLASGHVIESTLAHSSHTFCVRAPHKDGGMCMH